MTDDEYGELRKLRALADSLQSSLDRLYEDDVTNGLAVAAQTISLGSYPGSGSVGKTFACKPVDVSGSESEGATGTLTLHSEYVFAVNLGPNLPAVGTYVVIRRVPNAWVFYY